MNNFNSIMAWKKSNYLKEYHEALGRLDMSDNVYDAVSSPDQAGHEEVTVL
jgi:hypothetical protein